MKNKLLTLVLVLFTLFSFSQTRTVGGKVIGFNEYPINHVKVTTSRTHNVAYTDTLGNFKIKCKKNETLIFTANGFEKIREKIKYFLEDAQVNLIYNEKNVHSFSNAIVSKHMKKDDLEYCLANHLESNTRFSNLLSVYDVIQYVYPQAKLADIDGVTQVLLTARGPNSIFAGEEALLVVDGLVVNTIEGIDPIQIKTVNILQGNDAAHWGVRGGNGAVEITLRYGPH
jgi:hypothetical protein